VPEALKPSVQSSSCLENTPLHGIVQEEYGIFCEMEKGSLTFILMDEIVTESQNVWC